MPLPDNAMQFGDRFIGFIKDMNPAKIENRGANAELHPYVDGYEVTIIKEYPNSETNRVVTFTHSTSRNSKWGVWVSWWHEAGMEFSNKVIGQRYLFVEREHVWPMPERNVSVELPNAVCEVDDAIYKHVKETRFNLLDLDVTAIRATHMFNSGMVEREDDGYPSADQLSDAVKPPADDGKTLYQRLMVVFNEADGALSYDKFVVKVLTDPRFSNDAEAKQAIVSKDKLAEVGFMVKDNEVLPF